MTSLEIADLKQFITSIISQQTADFEVRFERIDKRFARLESRMDSLEQKVDDLSAAVGKALHTSNEILSNQINENKQRIGRLESRLS